MVKTTKVLIVEDSLSVQQLLQKIISDDPTLEVTGIVSDGKQAIEFVKNNRPDVITMDIMMPKMNGIDATREIMMENPIPIVIISGKYTKEDVNTSFEAMEAGAVSILEKPPGIKDPLYSETASNIQRTIRSVAGVKLITRRPKLAQGSFIKHNNTQQIEAVAIGSSLGGPQALKQVFQKLPKDFPLPIFVVQHIAKGFAEGFADWLNKSVPINVKVPQDNEIPTGGTVYIAPDDKHLIVTKDKFISFSNAPPIDGLKPAVDVLFASVNEHFGKKVLGVLLTGMGSDGSRELLGLHNKGATTIVQNEETCTAFGMPGSAVKLGAAKHVLSLNEISDYLNSLI